MPDHLSLIHICSLYFCLPASKPDLSGLPCYFFSLEMASEIEDILKELERIYAMHDPFYLSYARTKFLRLFSAPVSYTHLFLMPVEDVFSITGRGTVATGRVERGTLKVSDEVEIVGLTTEKRKVVVTGIEMFRKQLDQAMAGDNIGALLRGVQRTEIERGQVLAKPDSIHPHTKFEGEIYVLTKEEGGRHTPFVNNYRPQFYFRTTDVTGVISLPEGTEMCMPGDHVVISVELITPIAMDEGLRFAIREGGRTVGSGVVSKIIE